MHLATISGAMMLFTLCTAFCTPFPCLVGMGYSENDYTQVFTIRL